MSPPNEPPVERPEVGLCATCRHATVQQGARGSRFWRCLRAEHDDSYPRYPPLPVRRCEGYSQRGGSGRPTAWKKTSRKR